jgi:hypothetical protein
MTELLLSFILTVLVGILFELHNIHELLKKSGGEQNVNKHSAINSEDLG